MFLGHAAIKERERSESWEGLRVNELECTTNEETIVCGAHSHLFLPPTKDPRSSSSVRYMSLRDDTFPPHLETSSKRDWR